ncbi:TPA: DUF1270 family protein, partial [Staphylococcus aureus]|nr:DUF1270 family protein [Staphylococcus aureus]MCD0538926.1 DUF1270 family protein [Staphylococcus aureus]NGB91369.1 DUF1270 family protein [Staphylococcus aureus]NGS80791.1 DUF1270 family protein [Staphylococcus aureus]HCU8094252.1 DUF1270 family protein [Staphylococcus aureus]
IATFIFYKEYFYEE